MSWYLIRAQKFRYFHAREKKRTKRAGTQGSGRRATCEVGKRRTHWAVSLTLPIYRRPSPRGTTEARDPDSLSLCRTPYRRESSRGTFFRARRYSLRLLMRVNQVFALSRKSTARMYCPCALTAATDCRVIDAVISALLGICYRQIYYPPKRK